MYKLIKFHMEDSIFLLVHINPHTVKYRLKRRYFYIRSAIINQRIAVPRPYNPISQLKKRARKVPLSYVVFASFYSLL